SEHAQPPRLAWSSRSRLAWSSRSRLALPGACAATSSGSRARVGARVLSQPPLSSPGARARVPLAAAAVEPCNPAVGGPATSQLVHEVDALGGKIGKITDRCYLQKRVLNSSKGPAICALRAQPDKREYAIEMKNSVESTENLFIREAMATEVLIGKNDTIEGVCTFFSMDFMHHLLYLAPEHS
uniref:MnmG N-terminal domain-containing protein n=2 Tax=Zea mays TaxID=4577 RepID=A0A804N3P7_MAIZE